MPLLLEHPGDAAQWLRARVDAAAARRSDPRAAGMLVSDHRRLQPGDVFLAWAGRRHDGRAHVAAALAAGAAACLVDADFDPAHDAAALDAALAEDPRVALLPGLKRQAGVVADLFLGQPSRALQVLAVTGTNGKTSTAWWLAQALSALGRRCASIGTLGVGEPPPAGSASAAAAAAAGTDAGVFTDTGLTTPDAPALHAALRRLADDGVAACALEASSIGLAEHRLEGLHIAVALFTNLTQDHLDYHGSMAAYWAAKRRLFDWPGLGAAVVNIDDAQGRELAQALAARQDPGAPALWTVALHRPARLRAQRLRQGARGLAFEVLEAAEGGPPGPPVQQATLSTALLGEYSAANLLGVVAALRALGLPLELACAAAAGVGPVPGRLQRVAPPGADIDVLVDYAHTPDALQQVLRALRPHAAARGGRLWVVFGCGGNRDAGKRPLMGAIAAAEADAVVLTSDNPRDEAPAHILAQILAGTHALAGGAEPAVIEDRREAIAHAVAAAARGDVVLLAGKGHETTQETAGVKRPFSDAQEARAALQRRAQRLARPGPHGSAGRAGPGGAA
jgi:UDP-N-acetylmuramoyl-L-alanyl-D-glutamate--2,6-diaminopimelate ligase